MDWSDVRVRNKQKNRRDLIRKCRCVMVACFDRNSIHSKENYVALMNLDFSELVRGSRRNTWVKLKTVIG